VGHLPENKENCVKENRKGVLAISQHVVEQYPQLIWILQDNILITQMEFDNSDVIYEGYSPHFEVHEGNGPLPKYKTIWNDLFALFNVERE
jgi:hypothetical protein